MGTLHAARPRALVVIGLGPYRFVEFQPGVKLVVEAHERYWRYMPQVKRLVFKVVPDRSVRLARRCG